MRYLLSLILTILVSSISFSQELSLSAEAFAVDREIRSINISPDGTKLVTITSKSSIITQSLDNPELAYSFNLDGGNARSAIWYDNERIYIKGGSYDYVVDWKAKTEPVLIPRTVISLLPDDPDHVLTQGSVDVFKFNIKTKVESKLFQGPIYAQQYIADYEGEVRFANGGGNSIWNNHYLRSGYYRKHETSEWMKIFENDLRYGTGKVNENYYNSIVKFAGYTKDPNIIYVYSNDKNQKFSVYTFDVNSKTLIEKIISHNSYDISSIKFDENKEISAYYYNGKQPKWVALSDELKRIERITKKNFPDHFVNVQSISKDSSKVILNVSSPIDPGSYYLIDFNTNELKLLGYIYRKLDVDNLSEMHPIEFSARDGLKIHGYLTLPNQTHDKKSPMVVMPNSEAVMRNSWGFNYITQFLASRGYAVLQINHRGSTGYGIDYQTEGYYELGGKMLEDILDGTKWTINKGISDKKRICIFGFDDFGGYAAIQANIIDTSLFRCSIAFDPLINFKDYVQSVDSNYIEQRGQDLNSMSPYLRRSEFKTPLLLFRSTIGIPFFKSRYDRFMKALNKNNIELNYIDLVGKERPFKLLLLKEVEKFLDKHLKN